MQTLFGIRSNIAVVIIGSIYLIISLHTSIYGLKTFQEFPWEEHKPTTYLLINTRTVLFSIVTLTLSVSCLLSSILLILGIIEKRYGILKPWLIFNIILVSIFTSVFLFLTCLLIQFHQNSWYNVSGILLAIFINAIALAFHDYLWNGIYNLYKRLKKEAIRLYRVPDNYNDVIQII